MKTHQLMNCNVRWHKIRMVNKLLDD